MFKSGIKRKSAVVARHRSVGLEFILEIDPGNVLPKIIKKRFESKPIGCTILHPNRLDHYAGKLGIREVKAAYQIVMASVNVDLFNFC